MPHIVKTTVYTIEELTDAAGENAPAWLSRKPQLWSSIRASHGSVARRHIMEAIRFANTS